MKKEKTKYEHVGRPTNIEVKKAKRKKNLKIVGTITLVMFLIGSIFLYFNRDNIYLKSIMGDVSGETYSKYMKKIGENENITKVTFTPNDYNNNNYSHNNYSQEYAINNKTKFIPYLFAKAGFAYSKYKWNKIQLFNNGIYKTTVTTNNKELSISKYDKGDTYALKIFATNRKNGKTYVKYLRLYISPYIDKYPKCTIEANKIVSNNGNTKKITDDYLIVYENKLAITLDKNNRSVKYTLTCKSNSLNWYDTTIEKNDILIENKNLQKTNNAIVSNIKKSYQTKNTLKYSFEITGQKEGIVYISLKPYAITNSYNIYNIKESSLIVQDPSYALQNSSKFLNQPSAALYIIGNR